MHRPLIARVPLLLFAVVLLTGSAQAQWTAPNPVTTFDRQPDGVVFHMKAGTIRLQVCTPAIVHLLYSPTSAFPANRNPAVITTSWPESAWTVLSNDDEIALQTAALRVSVDRKTGAITYSASNGRVLLHDDSKTMTPVAVNTSEERR